MLSFIKPKVASWWLPDDVRLRPCYANSLLPADANGPRREAPPTRRHVCYGMGCAPNTNAPQVVYVKEIPHTATGKIDKKVLREQHKDALMVKSKL